MRMLVIFCFLFLLNQNVAAQTANEYMVKNFSMRSKTSRYMDSVSFRKFLDISQNQRDEFIDLEQEYQKFAEEIKTDHDLKLEEKLKKLLALKSEKQKVFETEILTKTQKAQLKNWFQFSAVMSDGLANSLVNGILASSFELSVEERKKIKSSAQKAFEKYQEKIIKAQKEAVTQMLSELPPEKRKQLKEFFKGIALQDGRHWNTNELHHFRIKNDPRLLMRMGLPDLDSPSQKPNKNNH